MKSNTIVLNVRARVRLVCGIFFGASSGEMLQLNLLSGMQVGGIQNEGMVC